MIKAAINNPYAVFVGMAIAVMFGLIALMTIPIQLKPSIEPPEISIRTFYWGAGPLEVEDQITNKIEEEVFSINDLERVVSTSQEGISEIRLVFIDSADKNKALIDTVQALKRVTDLPELAMEPEVSLVTGDEHEMIMWISVDGTASLNVKHDMIDEVVQPALMRVEGVGNVQFFGGVERKILVQPDPDKMAQHHVSFSQLAGVIAAENLNARGGYLEEGDRQFMVRTLGKYESLDDVLATVIRHGPTGTITVADVATVQDGRDRRIGYVHMNGVESLAMGVNRQSDANTVTTIKAIQAELALFNERFAASGVDMQLNEAFSELHYVLDAINLVRNNVFIGAILAALVLALFLRAGRPIIIVLVTIPVSLITVFIILLGMGRTINIISLAGIAFSVGIVVDNAIVVLENIDRHMRELGKTPVKAAFDAITEISGAIFASTMTTVAVFIPVVLNTTEAGLLFKDIAIAVVCAVLMSLVAANTLVPSLGAMLMRTKNLRAEIAENKPELDRLLSVIELQWVGRAFEATYHRFLDWSCSGRGHGTTLWRLVFLACVFGIFAVSMLLLPSANYLPNGTREFIFCVAQPVVGQRNEVSLAALKPIEDFAAAEPRVSDCFAVSASPFITGAGLVVKRELSNETNLQDITQQVQKIGFQIPGFQFFYAMRSSIFMIRDKEFTLEVTGEDLAQLKKTADSLLGQLYSMPHLVQMARLDYTEGVPELGIQMDRHRLAQHGLTLSSVAMDVEMMLGGRDVSTYSEGGREYDLMIKGAPSLMTDRDKLASLEILTPRGENLRLDEVAEIYESTGPSTIRHYNRQRSIQLTVNTNPAIPTQVALDEVAANVVGPTQAQLGPGYSIRFGEAADKLRETLSSLVFQGILAIIIVYLLMVALFMSFSYPMVILVTIPLAWSGSFLAMAIANFVTHGVVQFDVLGMLGLIILTGIVVNNAILIIHQMINNETAGMEPVAALRESARTRLRPIFMSVLTSVFGMLPLAVIPGSGSELYRGLGIIVVGGLFISTIFTLFVVPTIMSLIQEAKENRNLKKYGTRRAPEREQA
ncbi:efflux RND transporter permease subunit [bacterium]|nr:efflux RND transporter permease subunit [bacterium]